MATFETGEPQVLVPATLRRHVPSRSNSIAMTVTTIKRGDTVVVLLSGAE
jgi:hypothetical protein